MVILDSLVSRIRRAIMRRLETPSKGYHQRIYNDVPNLYKFIRKGDIVLIEGRSEMSRLIKLFCQSHWSHNAVYVGDELIKKGRPFRDRYLAEFGADANHLIIEAFAGRGVVAAPLVKYKDYNIRICRPFAIHPEDLSVVIETIIENLGNQYDEKNIIDLAFMLLPAWFNPFKQRNIKACLGSCNDFKVICSGMTARAFQKVGFPIIPELSAAGSHGLNLKDNPYGSKLLVRHYSQILPRDFDLSPNFDIIKFNIIAAGKFDYKAISWDDGDSLPEKTGGRK